MIIIPQWIVAVLIYCIIVTILVSLKPALMFFPDGQFKKFGVGLIEGNSPFAASIVFPFIAIICYIMASLFKLALI